MDKSRYAFSQKQKMAHLFNQSNHVPLFGLANNNIIKNIFKHIPIGCKNIKHFHHLDFWLLQFEFDMYGFLFFQIF